LSRHVSGSGPVRNAFPHETVPLQELIENALDAQATAVDLRLKEYGFDSIEVIALKHCTSKISAFEDLYSARTFGFRGEALSSLCAISRVAVTTSTSESAPAGVRLQYDKHGKLAETIPVARTQGTTVSITNLFEDLPVRHREFKRNIKKEYAKCLELVQAYALVSTGVRITCSNQVGKGPRNTVLATKGHASMKDNISDVFGSKILNQLAEVKIDLDPELESTARVVGYMSSQAGRNSVDRQFLFLNGRPCNLTKIARAINEVFREFSPHQYPILILNMQVPEGSYDRNITPDKRTIFLQDENSLIGRLKDAMRPFLESFHGTFASQQVQSSGFSSTPIASSFSQFSSTVSSQPTAEASHDDMDTAVAPLAMSDDEELEHSAGALFAEEDEDVAIEDEIDTPPQSQTAATSPAQARFQSYTAPEVVRLTVTQKLSRLPSRAASLTPRRTPFPIQRRSPIKVYPPTRPAPISLERVDTTSYITSIQEDILATIDVTTVKPRKRQRVTTDSDERRFELDVVPDQDGLAVEELNRNVSKDDFGRMQILGQFNLGFILVRLDEDLFIVDQHASDEKFNFESFKRQPVDTQQLIRPLCPDLTPQQELIALDQRDLLATRGFIVEYVEEARPGRRIMLMSVPQSRSTFGVADFEELLHKLSDESASTETVQCSRMEAVWASKACRKSVMIGMPLDVTQMTR
ncbi:Mismatch repair endonuclease pms2, partial [Rhizophlyctis rosea]